MKVPEYYMTLLQELSEGTRKPPEGISLSQQEPLPRAIELQQQIQGMGLPEFLRRCAAQDGTELDEDELEALKPENLLAALARDPAPTQTPPEALEDLEGPKEPDPPVIEEPDDPRSVYSVLLDCCSLDEDLLRYLAADDDGVCAVIDPGYTPERVLEAAQRYGLTIRAVLLTHGHFDHVGGVRGVAEAARCPVWLCEADTVLPERLTAGPLYYTDTYADGDTVEVGSLRFTVLETPGHTPGSVCLLCENVLFSGDTLFAGSCGRVDLAGGVPAQMGASLKRLAELPGNYAVLPGHGPATTLDAERADNPYLREAMA